MNTLKGKDWDVQDCFSESISRNPDGLKYTYGDCFKNSENKLIPMDTFLTVPEEWCIRQRIDYILEARIIDHP